MSVVVINYRILFIESFRYVSQLSGLLFPFFYSIYRVEMGVMWLLYDIRLRKEHVYAQSEYGQ